MANRLESESGSWGCYLEVLGVIDQKHGVSDGMFPLKFVQELLCYRSRRCRKHPNMEELGRLRFDRSVQPVLLFVDSDHGFGECDVIRIRITDGL